VSYKRDIARLIRKLDGLLAEEEIAVIAAYHARGEFGLAVEQIGTRLHDLDVAIDCALAGEIASVCRKLQIRPRQWEFIYELTNGSTGGDGARALPPTRSLRRIRSWRHTGVRMRPPPAGERCGRSFDCPYTESKIRPRTGGCGRAPQAVRRRAGGVAEFFATAS
jgi:hypothetical protein